MIGINAYKCLDIMINISPCHGKFPTIPQWHRWVIGSHFVTFVHILIVVKIALNDTVVPALRLVVLRPIPSHAVYEACEGRTECSEENSTSTSNQLINDAVVVIVQVAQKLLKISKKIHVIMIHEWLKKRSIHIISCNIHC